MYKYILKKKLLFLSHVLSNYFFYTEACAFFEMSEKLVPFMIVQKQFSQI